MSQTETTVAPSEDFVIRIPKKIVKITATVAAVTAAVATAVYVTKNLSVETTENSLTLEVGQDD